MRRILALVVFFLLFACHSAKPARSPSSHLQSAVPAPPPRVPTSPPPSEPANTRLTSDTPMTTVLGNTFIAPAGWSIAVRGPATILEAPEGDSHIVLADVHAGDAETALAAGWAAYKSEIRWPLMLVNDSPDKDGWSKQRSYFYQTSPNERRDVFASVLFAGDVWTVLIYDMAHAVAEKRGAQVSLILGRLLPKSYSRETFASKKPNQLDKARIAELGRFVESGQKALAVPGVSLGLIQDGKVVLAGGFGVRELGGKAKVDADTLYMIASTTKALTTLLLAKLVDQGNLTWETPVTSLLPSFKLGDADTTRRVLVKHLVCACTGLPRQDLEGIFEFEGVTPEGVLATLSTVQPTSKFGEAFQYSNLLAAAAGFVAGHVLYPKLELGAAYDKAMKTQVFEPLRMRSTTFDYARALGANHASPHAVDNDGTPAFVVKGLNESLIPVRPAGGGWSNVNDMLSYVAMELAEGGLPSGAHYIAKGPLLARREPQVSIGEDMSYGMGLIVDTTYGIPIVRHGGDVAGFHSAMFWLPEQNVGAVILTNASSGALIRNIFPRKLLEVLFDGHPEADAELAAAVKTYFELIALGRKLLAVPANANDASQLAVHYVNSALGDLTVSHVGSATLFDFGEWKSEVGSLHNPDGSLSFITIAPGIYGFELVVGSGKKRTLVLRDAQHEYVFEERVAGG